MRMLKPLVDEDAASRVMRDAFLPACEPVVDDASRGDVGAAPLIVHVIHRLDIGGLENGLVNLINHMPSDRYRHAIVCMTEASDFQRRLRRPDVKIFALHKRPGKDLVVYFRLWRLLRAMRPAVVHSRNLGTLDTVIPAALAGVRHRVHGEHGWDTSDLYGKSKKYRLLRYCCQPLLDRYISVSRDLQSWLGSRVGVSGRKLTQIYNGVDTCRFHPAIKRGSLAPPRFASPDSVVIGTVGRMHEVKDPLTLVRAFLLLIDRIPKASQRLRLVMIGDGPLRAAALALIEHADASALAWLPGARDDVPELLRTFDVFVLPSLNEGISNTILEAMATGLPVIATRVGGNPELVSHNRWGILIPPSDPEALARALQAYLDTPGLKREHGRAGRNRVEQSFSIDAMVSNYLNLYDEVLGTTPNSAKNSTG